MSKKFHTEIGDDGWTINPTRLRGKMGKRKRPKFRTKEDAEKDRKFRTGIRPSKKGGGWN
jgi:hypothetical protein